MDKFLSYWDVVSEFFSNNRYVIGFDPLNEPYPGDAVKNPFLAILPGYFDRKRLQPLYSKIYKTYQKYDESKIMFFDVS